VQTHAVSGILAQPDLPVHPSCTLAELSGSRCLRKRLEEASIGLQELQDPATGRGVRERDR
jgi:hypothetical protein